MELYLDLEPPDWSLLGSLVLFGDEGDTVARTHERFGKPSAVWVNASPAKREVDGVKMRPPHDSTFGTFAQKTGWAGSVDAVRRKRRFR
jgi:hypothetical protein